MRKYLIALAVLLLPTAAHAQTTMFDQLEIYGLVGGGITEVNTAPARGTLNTPGGPISGNADIDLDSGVHGGVEVGVRTTIGESIRIMAGPYIGYSRAVFKQIQPENATFGGGGGALFLPTIDLDGYLSTLETMFGARVGLVNDTFVEPHVLVRAGAWRNCVKADRFGGATIASGDCDWTPAVELGIGATVALSDQWSILVEGAHGRTLGDPRFSISTPAGTATVDVENERYTVFAGLVLHFN